MILRKNWHTRDWAKHHWYNGYYNAYMDPYTPSNDSGNFIEWGNAGDFDDREPDWIFRHEDAVDEYWMDDILTEFPYEGNDACSPEPGLVYEFGPRGEFSNVRIAECEVEGRPLLVWLVMYED